MTGVLKTPALTGSVMRSIASNWSLSTIFQTRSGQPLDVILGTDVALNGFQGNSGSQRPDQVLADPYGDRSSLTNYFNRAAFTPPQTGSYGNLGSYALVGPSYWEWNESISREFRIRENQALQIRAEAFNVTNSLRPGNPGTNFRSSNTFGRILSSAGDPRILQFALKYSF